MIITRNMSSFTSRQWDGDNCFEARNHEHGEPQIVQEAQAKIDPLDARIDQLGGLVERLVERDVRREAEG